MKNVNSDRAYDFIRRRILSGEYQPGHALMTNMLSGEIGVSRTPVRDALRQLEADGLVSIRARLGASVKTMDLKEFRELCGLRLALESYAAGLAAVSRTEGDLQEINFALESLHVITERIVASSDDEPVLVGELVREDVRFHIAIMTAAKSDLMKKEILRLHLINRVVAGPPPINKDRPVGDDLSKVKSRRRAVMTEHQAIYDAIKQGNAANAKNAMESHIQDIIESNLRNMARAESRLIAKELTKEELAYTT
jgi:DNA-binding GntR family transcriptional regulator